VIIHLTQGRRRVILAEPLAVASADANAKYGIGGNFSDNASKAVEYSRLASEQALARSPKIL